jgi:hypothetical protein
MPDAHLTLATSLIEGTFRFLDMLVWPVCLVYVLSKPVVQTWITVLVDRIAEVVEVRHGKTVVKLPPRPVSSFVIAERETVSDGLPTRSLPVGARKPRGKSSQPLESSRQ